MIKKIVFITAIIIAVLVPIVSANPSTNLRVTFEGSIGESAKKELITKYGGEMFLPLHNQLILENIFERLVAVVNEESDYNYSLTILNSNTANAFALPGGYIFITKGLLELVDFEHNQIAAVLAHEIAHVEQRHGLNSLLRQLGLGVLIEVGFYYLDLHRTDAVRVAAGALIEVVQSGYSREAELEADQLAQEYCVKAKFSPTGIIHLLSKLQKHEGESNTGMVFRSHPYLTERINILKAEVPSFWAQPQLVSPSSSLRRQENQDPLGRFTLNVLNNNDQEWAIIGYDEQNDTKIDWFDDFNAREATWSPNGQILAVTILDKHEGKQSWSVAFFNRLGLAIDQWDFNNGGEIKNLMFSPDGTKLAYNLEGHSSSTLWVRAIDGTVDIDLELGFVASIIDWNKTGLIVKSQDHELYVIAPPKVETVVLSEPVPQVIQRKPRLRPNNNIFQFEY